MCAPGPYYVRPSLPSLEQWRLLNMRPSHINIVKDDDDGLSDAEYQRRLDELVRSFRKPEPCYRGHSIFDDADWKAWAGYTLGCVIFVAVVRLIMAVVSP